MKIRIKFAKKGQMRFIGHLDVMRYFQKAIRRAGIDICYSEGFSPHQKMSFASPLGVGLTSRGEYFDIEVNTTKSSAESIAALNSVMVEGMKVLSYIALPDQARNGMASIAAADYNVYLKDDNIITEEMIDNFLAMESILITKKTKKGEREVDLRPFIYEMKLSDNNISEKLSEKIISMKVAAGSVNNIKPELVIDTLCRLSGIETVAASYERTEMYADSGTEDGIQFVPLESLGDVIE